MRSLLCVLSGRQVKQDKRGKNAKHRDIWHQDTKAADGKIGSTNRNSNAKASVFHVPDEFTKVHFFVKLQ